MEFKDFSLHVNHTKVGQFVRGLASGKIMATQCRTCRTKFYPPKADCPRCWEGDIEWIPLETRGKLASFTMIYVAPDHFAAKTVMPFSSISLRPCPVGLLEIEDGLRIMGWIPNVDRKALRVGMALRAAPHTLIDGRVTIILEPYTPVPESASTTP
jgi:hypothetical protein